MSKLLSPVCIDLNLFVLLQCVKFGTDFSNRKKNNYTWEVSINYECPKQTGCINYQLDKIWGHLEGNSLDMSMREFLDWLIDLGGPTLNVSGTKPPAWVLDWIKWRKQDEYHHLLLPAFCLPIVSSHLKLLFPHLPHQGGLHLQTVGQSNSFLL